MFVKLSPPNVVVREITQEIFPLRFWNQQHLKNRTSFEDLYDFIWSMTFVTSVPA